MLRQEDVKLLDVRNIDSSIQFEKQMLGKIGTLTALFMLRHKTGEDKLVDWLTHASKAELDMSSQTVLENGFNSLLMVNEKTVEFMLANQPAFLKGILEGLLEQARGGKMGQYIPESISKLGRDMRLKYMRKILSFIAESGSADQSMKTLSTRLILRMGYLHATSEDLLLAADMQQSYDLDLTWDLMPLLETSEKVKAFVPPAKPSGDGE